MTFMIVITHLSVQLVSNYEPYEGDKDSVQVVYSALRLGSVYRFDTDSRYDVVKTNKYGTTALTTVVY